jgi:hypothetical protein|tara:strand:+ start:110 stop:325 length:216 start_codon:yes stop_codon:yes gene_type:complete
MAIIKDENNKFNFELTDDHFIAWQVRRDGVTIEEATKVNERKGDKQFWVRMDGQDVEELEAFTKKIFGRLN